ncbi:hypothetical protein [Lewinella sp. 4G2]|uniref:hypothetical protein n=1 Tax=Lewinella sp. 4G2 TaxID=1803372 RepID=UPI0007B465F7|nr:hypothetical protein [Lewinella sp. 4G2]OAV43982.1 hypothetical protein A3850_005505 [Lewinella sp. 4G2]
MSFLTVPDLRSGYINYQAQNPQAPLPKSKIQRLKSLSLLILIIALSSCSPDQTHPPLQTTYYHWETTLAPSATQRQLLAGTDRLYVKAFDVVWEGNAAAPTAEIELVDTAGLPALIPVIFITNEVMRRMPQAEIPGLANDLVAYAEDLLPAGFDELQIDCDWTALTQVPYFELLDAIKKARTGRQLTCTIRLHQYRDRDRQGIPPVDRGTLMAYNVGDLDNWEMDNSIYDPVLVKGYLAGQPPYPLPLDLAVAVYDWAAVYRRGELTLLINEPDLEGLGDSTRFTALSPNRYRADTTTYLNGQLLYPGDLLRYEVASPDSVNVRSAQLREWTGSFPGQRLVVYRVGSRLWN